MNALFRVEPKDKINLCYFNFFTEAVILALENPAYYRNGGGLRGKRALEKIKRIRREFADSRGIQMWCDCTDNFHHEKIKKIIIDYNS